MQTEENEQHIDEDVYATCGVQYEPQNCCSKEVQCNTAESKRSRCYFEDLYQIQYTSSSTQCDFREYVTKDTQCSFLSSDVSCQTSLADLLSGNEITKSRFSGTAGINNTLQKQCVYKKDCGTSTVEDNLWNNKEFRHEKNSWLYSVSKSTVQQSDSQFMESIHESGEFLLVPDCSMKEGDRFNERVCITAGLRRSAICNEKEVEVSNSTTEEQRPREMNAMGVSCSKLMRKQRKSPCLSSSTSGVAEMSESRSGFSETIEEHATAIGPVKKAVKQKKRQLWTQTHKIASIAVCSEPLNFPTLITEKESRLSPLEMENKNVLDSLYSRRKYTRDEQLLIIKYIAEQSLYCRVGGVSMWQDMAAEVRVNRTWQSLKEHFRKQILPNIKEYGLSSSVQKLFCMIKMK